MATRLDRWVHMLASIGFVFISCTSFAEPIVVRSPDGRNSIELSEQNGALRCTVQRDGSAFFNQALIGLEFRASEPIQVSLSETGRVTVDRTVYPVAPTIASELTDHYNEAVVEVDPVRSIRMRAYDEGVAYRWEIRSPVKSVEVSAESLDLSSLSNNRVWLPIPNGEGFWSHQECTFEEGICGDVLDGTPRCGPVLFGLGDGEFAVLSDVGNHAYPGMWIADNGDGANIVFPPYPRTEVVQNMRNTRAGEVEPYIARVSGDAVLSWRAVAFDDALGLLDNSLFYLLAEPSRIEDTDWIKPGLVAWDWWNALNITGVDFESGVNQQTYMHFIDFANEYGLPYVILDEGWSRPEPDGLLDVIPEIDMPALAEYAEQRGVKLILWMTATMLDASFDEAFEQFEAWGIAGIKVDFMQRDDQVMMERCYRIAEAAAESRLLVDFHGGSKPQGITRTYPNVLTIESVMGLEQTKWGGPANPQMSTVLPFTRMTVGPMDYTPGAMRNMNRKQFEASMDRPTSLGTRAHQLAMYVVYLSPLQMLADSPTNYRLFPESTRFIAGMPVTWDETVPLVAEIGDLVAVARRHGDSWYIGALSDWKSRSIEVDLGFLGSGDFDATLAIDGPNAHRNGEDVMFSSRVFTAEDTLSIHLASGGGAAVVLKPR